MKNLLLKIALVWVILLGLTACGGGSLTAPAQPPPPKKWSVKPTGSLIHARMQHTATLLANGKVLIIGGVGAMPELSIFSQAIPLAELYDPATQTFTPAGTLNYPRAAHCSVLLPNGKVIVFGGASVGASLPLNNVEEWDPATMSFSIIGGLQNEHLSGQAFFRQDGKIEVVGGYNSEVPITLDDFKTEILDPETGTSSYDFSLTDVEDNSTLIPVDGSHFMLLGGENGMGSWHQLDSAVLYDTDATAQNPVKNWTMPYWFTEGQGIKLTDGRVCVTGGESFLMPVGINSDFGIMGVATIIDPSLIRPNFTIINLSKGRVRHQVVLFPDGAIGLIGGETYSASIASTYLSDIEVVDPVNQTASLLPVSLQTARSLHTVTPLQDGSYLVVGGVTYAIFPTGAATVQVGSCELLYLK